jgi:diguanylate cyclase (GGDEF)-like protein
MSADFYLSDQHRKSGFTGRQNFSLRPLFGRFSVIDNQPGGATEQPRTQNDSLELSFFNHFINTLTLNDPDTVLKTGVRELSRMRPGTFLLLCREAEELDSPLLLAVGPTQQPTSQSSTLDNQPHNISVIELRPSIPAATPDQEPRNLCQAAILQSKNGDRLTLYTDYPPTEQEQRLLECCFQYLGKRFDEARKWQSLKEISRHDSLTRLFNRRYFDETLPRECERSSRYHRPLALIMLDLDHFKQLNDCYGHPAGDRVLHICGRLLKQSLRCNDIPCRYGGEELAIILPETSLNEATQIAERLCQQLAERKIDLPDGNTVKVTASFGVAGSQQTDSNSLLAAADQALYQAKAGGRNQVRVCSDENLRSAV